MQIPQIPTDNLYKFMAVAGLVLFAICLIYPKFLVADSRKATAKTTVDFATLKDDLDALNRAADSIAKDTARLHATKGKLDRAEVERIEQEIQDNKRANKVLRANVRAFELNANTVLAEAQRSIFLVGVMGWAMVPSLILMLLGFVLWYFKAQRHVDEMLRLQALAARIEANKNLANAPPASIEKWNAI